MACAKYNMYNRFKRYKVHAEDRSDQHETTEENTSQREGMITPLSIYTRN